MKLHFFKYQGTGNDFVMIDNRLTGLQLTTEQIAFLCDRRFGIGADGFILLENANGYDFRMVYYNADGREGSMCGNGGRCAAKFAHDLGIFASKTSFLAVDGPHEAEIETGSVSLKMKNTAAAEAIGGCNFYNTGSPHLVCEKDDVDKLDVYTEGRALRYSPFWVERGGTNVNFVCYLGKNSLKVRTYERGVEDETYSCGTGVTACAIDAFVEKGWAGPIAIETKGGELNVSFEQTTSGGFGNIWLKGPAERVFSGEIELNEKKVKHLIDLK